MRGHLSLSESYIYSSFQLIKFSAGSETQFVTPIHSPSRPTYSQSFRLRLRAALKLSAPRPSPSYRPKMTQSQKLTLACGLRLKLWAFLIDTKP